MLVAAAIAAFFSVAAYETVIRNDFPRDTLRQAMEMSAERARLPGVTLKELGNPTMRPIVIATQEVQARNFLDRRFVIRSLDGILDIAYLNYLCHGYNDQDGYFIDQKVDFVVAPFANYNHDRSRWSLARLENLPIGQSIDRPGIRYTKISHDAVQVSRKATKATDRAIQPCQIDAANRYF